MYFKLSIIYYNSDRHFKLCMFNQINITFYKIYRCSRFRVGWYAKIDSTSRIVHYKALFTDNFNTYNYDRTIVVNDAVTVGFWCWGDDNIFTVEKT